jgi:hypothetical protein
MSLVENGCVHVKGVENNHDPLDLDHIKRSSIWNISRVASEHLDRLAWALQEEDDAEIRRQTRAVVSHIKAVVLLVNDLNGEGSP